MACVRYRERQMDGDATIGTWTAAAESSERTDAITPSNIVIRFHRFDGWQWPIGVF